MHKQPSSVEPSREARDALQRHRDRASWILSRHSPSPEDSSTSNRWAWPIIGLYLLMAACLIGGAVVSAPTETESAVASSVLRQ